MLIKLMNSIILSIVLLLLLTSWSRKPMDLNTVKAQVIAKVPVGSTASQVIQYLDSAKCEHSDYLNDKKEIRAIMRNSSRTVLIKGSIQLRFQFDANEKLESIEVKEVFTGP